MRSSKLLSAALAAMLAVGTLGGCVLRTSGAYRVRVAPPPPRHVYVETRPGWVYIDGYWNWNGYEYVWVDGYYERERPGHIWVRGYWTNDRGYHTYRRGHWRRGGDRTVIIHKDRGHDRGQHRGNKRPTVIYDHSR